MNLLITNDDGWGFDGIETLTEVAREFGDVWVVAPHQPMSGISHQITFEVPMSFTERQPRSFSLTGTPADCVRVACTQLDVEFDWVLSGINNGANLGVDVYISGTVAAAREATFFGHRAIAFSQYLNGFRQPFEWPLAAKAVKRLLPELFESDLGVGEFYNVNLPDTQGQPVDGLEIVSTQMNRHPLPQNYQPYQSDQIMYCGRYRERKYEPGTDIDACFNGKISVSRHRPDG
ncbi:MAG: 5'/3'-nucleotidase SurE [Planctomycetota bacterium]